VVAAYEDSGETRIIPNGQWTLVEEEVIVDTMTLEERECYNEKVDALFASTLDIAKRTYTGTPFPELPFTYPKDWFSSEFCEEFDEKVFMIKDGEYPDMTMYPFFDRDKYLVFVEKRSKHKSEWSAHLKYISDKMEKKHNPYPITHSPWQL
jgi:hypothetical protein